MTTSSWTCALRREEKWMTKKAPEAIGSLLCVHGFILKRKWDMEGFIFKAAREGNFGRFIEFRLLAASEEKEVVCIRVQLKKMGNDGQPLQGFAGQ